MPAELFKVRLTRDNPAETWGFSVSGGGNEKLLQISEIEVGGLAEQIGLVAGDVVVQLNNVKAESLAGPEANEILKKSENQIEILFLRNLELCEDPRYHGLRPGDRKKVGFHDVTKPVLRKDWNCPWVKRDGKGLKNVVRNYFGTDPVPAPIKTSHNHFYSEPQSILAPEPSAEAIAELERIIQEKVAQEEAERNEKKLREQQQQQLQRDQQLQQQREQQMQLQRQQQREQEAAAAAVVVASETDSRQRAVRSQSPPPQVEEEEDLCPALETVDAVKAEVQQQQQLQQQQQDQQFLQDLSVNSSLLREIVKAIQAGMERYQGCSEGYEPSADELIEVLKNLENLAAANPALYRAIVDQIKVHQPADQGHDQHYGQQQEQHVASDYNGNEEQETNGHHQYENYEGQQEFVSAEEDCYQQNGSDELDRQAFDPRECQETPTQEYQPQVEMTPEERKREGIRLQVEREHEQQMQRMRAQKQMEAPKKIVVVAGSKNRPAWPIAPGIDNGTVPRQIELTAGSAEMEEEMLRSRMEVAQAAGLKHVDVINGDDTFYPQPMKDYDYPWAGSLHPVSHEMVRTKHKKRGNDDDLGANPWAGSLHHVEDKRRGKPKPKNPDEIYGDAPWMGTLRHIKVEPKNFNPLKPQFKRYPDEDAPNPYSATQGCGAKPCYPLTPAAIISASGGSKEERERAKQEEEVERIRSNLRETRTVSSALLKAIMPKLLKEHQSKQDEGLDHMESIKIMEEILGMQIGLNNVAVEDEDDEKLFAFLNEDPRKSESIMDKKKKKKKPTSKANTKELAPGVQATS